MLVPKGRADRSKTAFATRCASRPNAPNSRPTPVCTENLNPGIGHSGWHEIDRSGSPDRDRDRYVDITPDRIRVWADGMSTLDEPFSGLLVDASNNHGKRGGQHEASCFISTKVDPGDDVDIVIGKAMAGVPTHMKECVLKAGCIPAGEELFGIGRIAPSAKGPGQCELEVEQTVFAADRTVTAAARRYFCGI
jgi:hypothetical protein